MAGTKRSGKRRMLAGAVMAALLLAGCGAEGTVQTESAFEEQAGAEQTATEQTDAEQTAAEQAGAGQTAAEQTDAAQNDAERDGAEQTTAGQNGAEQTDAGQTNAEAQAGDSEEIRVEPIEGLREDFICGVDISSVLAEEESGVVYYNEAGQAQDIFQTLAENGVNYVRVRVWNDPFDENGKGYGGGNCDTAAAAEIGRRAARQQMKLCVNFHYSDFWADPSKQMCPKAWEGMEALEKAEALYAFTVQSLEEILDGGADVGMVQIGNEINNGMAGETDWSARGLLLQAGARAVRDVEKERGQEIRIAVHFTDIADQTGTLALAQKLKEKEIDYDIFAVSYYPFWHGTMENLTDTLQKVNDAYGKDVLVVENSYPYTTGDGDGTANSIGARDVLSEYPASVQGQAQEIRDVCAAVAAVGEAGLGYFYWEPAWIPVNVWEKGAADADETLAANKEAWEEKGAGWASSYASGYDPKDAGKYYGGSSWDNQALFDYHGHPLASLKVFRCLRQEQSKTPAS